MATSRSSSATNRAERERRLHGPEYTHVHGRKAPGFAHLAGAWCDPATPETKGSTRPTTKQKGPAAELSDAMTARAPCEPLHGKKGQLRDLTSRSQGHGQGEEGGLPELLAGAARLAEQGRLPATLRAAARFGKEGDGARVHAGLRRLIRGSP